MLSKTTTFKMLRRSSSLLKAFFCCLLVLGLYLFRPLPVSSAFDIKDLVVSDGTQVAFNNSREHFSQSYFYLGHGRQSIAFLSADKKIVLKFFLNNQVYGLKSNWKSLDRRISYLHKKNITQAMSAYKKVYQEKPEIGALIALHFHKTSDLPPVIAYGKHGEKIEIDLNLYSFVVQHKCTTFFEEFKNSKTSLEMDEIINRTQRFILEKISLGFFDKRNHLFLYQNYGFWEDQIVQLDLGDLLFSEKVKDDPKQLQDKVRQKIQKWKIKNLQRTPS